MNCIFKKDGFTVNDLLNIFAKLDPASFIRLRSTCKMMSYIVTTYKRNVKVAVVSHDIVIGPISTKATINQIESSELEKHNYGLFIFPHDNNYFDIKRDGMCSAHHHWIAERREVKFEDIATKTFGFIFHNIEVRWLSTNSSVIYPEKKELAKIIDKIQQKYINVRVSELKADTIRFLAKKLKPRKLKIYNVQHPILEDMTESFLTEDFNSIVVEGGGPFTCFCSSILKMAQAFEEFIYIKHQDLKSDDRPEDIDILADIIYDFIQGWVAGIKMKISSFYLSNIKIPWRILSFKGLGIEYLELTPPNYLTLMWQAPKGLFNREDTIYNSCIVIPQKGMGLMIVGIKNTDLFARIVYTEEKFAAALTEFYPVTPLDFSALAKLSDQTKFDKYLTKLSA